MYDSQKFSNAGLPAPAAGWTIDAFKNAVKTLKLDPKDPPPFEAPGTGGLHLLMLTAAYGGLPIDFRTDPPTISFTDPATVDAIRQVLDLAKQGYLKYDAVGNLMGGVFFNSGPTAAIYTETLSLFSFNRAMDTAKSNAYKPTVYPRGSTYGAASYNVSTAYISAKSSVPEACYRWISTLAKHPELLSALPARRSLLSALAETQGPDVVALYNETDKLLQDPNTITFPSQFSSGTSLTGYLIQHWLYQAFDKYVLEDKDLEAALKDAEGIAKGFQACTVNLPPLDTSDTEKARNYIKQFGDCATKVDPSLKSLFDLMPR
jgi:ABC-type glycerol-3-phosphate transport system substrate-binding protein